MSELNISIFRFLNGFANQSTTVDTVVIFLGTYLPYILVAVFTAVIIFGQTFFQRKTLYLLSAGFISLFISGLTVVAIRYFYHHLRPLVALPSVNILLTEFSYSFPSAHATIFFALSAVMYQYHKLLGILFFIASGLIGIARIVAGVHYPLDILAGVLIGAIIGFLCYKGIEVVFLRSSSVTKR